MTAPTPTAADVTRARERASSAVERTAERCGPLREVVRSAAKHHTLTLAAGLAFFGLVSFGPALALGFGLLRIVGAGSLAERLVELLQGGLADQLQLADLVEQTAQKAGRYAGISLLVLLWPATTLASGWTRALDAVLEQESEPGTRGLVGRVKGTVLGLMLLAGPVLLLAAGGVALSGGVSGPLVAVVVAVGALVGFLVTCLVLYRYFPSETRAPWRAVVPGAVLATATATVATAVLALIVGRVLSGYPPALSTAVLLGLWLYTANAGLLLGAELNAIRSRR